MFRMNGINRTLVQKIPNQPEFQLCKRYFGDLTKGTMYLCYNHEKCCIGGCCSPLFSRYSLEEYVICMVILILIISVSLCIYKHPKCKRRPNRFAVCNGHALSNVEQGSGQDRREQNRNIIRETISRLTVPPIDVNPPSYRTLLKQSENEFKYGPPPPSYSSICTNINVINGENQTREENVDNTIINIEDGQNLPQNEN